MSFSSKCVLSAAYSLLSAVGKHHGGLCAYGQFNGKTGGGAVDAHWTVERAHSGFDLFHVAHERGVDKQMPHAMGAGIIVDACQGAEKPFVNLSHHEVIP